MNKKKWHLNILWEQLLPTIYQQFGDEHFLFLHDEGLCAWKKGISKWLIKQNSHILISMLVTIHYHRTIWQKRIKNSEAASFVKTTESFSERLSCLEIPDLGHIFDAQLSLTGEAPRTNYKFRFRHEYGLVALKQHDFPVRPLAKHGSLGFDMQPFWFPSTFAVRWVS